MKPSETILTAIQDPTWEIKDINPHPIGVQFYIKGASWRGKVTITENGSGQYNVRFFISGAKKPVIEDSTTPNVALANLKNIITQKVG